MRKIIACLTLPALLAGCALPSQNQYGYEDVGHNAVILYGTVMSEREVAITGQNTGTGAVIGAGGGALAGSAIGRGNGSLVGLLAGAVIGGVAGAAAEQAMADRKGIEYIVRFKETGETQSIVQNIAKSDAPIATGQCVMVQMSGNYQRVLPAPEDFPDCHVHHGKKHHPKAEG